MSPPKTHTDSIVHPGPDGAPVRWRFKSLEWEVFSTEIDVGGRGASPDGAIVDLVKTATRLLEEYRADGPKLHGSASAHLRQLESVIEHLNPEGDAP